MAEEILSAGIDIGTTTSQLIFSRLTLEKTGGYGVVPKVEVVNREVIFRSKIHITPLTDEDTIDASGVAKLIAEDYAVARIKPEEINSGAVIITGESAAKRNARQLTEAIAKIAGNFVVAAAGPDLEDLLAGKGSGAASISEEELVNVLNLDIGGGTTNLCLFHEGQQVDCGCLDIGGRLIRLDSLNRIEKISPKLRALLKNENIDVEVGDILDEKNGLAITRLLSDILAEAVGLKEESRYLNGFITNHNLVNSKGKIDVICFSGGVADCIWDALEGKDNSRYNTFEFNDLGVLLGRAIAESPYWKKANLVKGNETLRATVIGAGSCSMEVSGSTIYNRNALLPMESIPVYSIKASDDFEISTIASQIANMKENASEMFENGYALAMELSMCPSFSQLEGIAEIISRILEKENFTIPLIMKTDIAKALGQALKRRLPKEISILCLDQVECETGDFVDIGKPLGGGIALPVVVKTLIFK